MWGEEKRNKKVHREPSAKPQQSAPFMVSRTRLLSPLALASEMRGSSSTEREFVMTAGKRMTAIAIPDLFALKWRCSQ